jgi:DNA replication protein DnaC
MSGARRLYRLAIGYEGNPLIGFCDGDEREHFAQTADASGNRSSHARNRVHYVTALPGSGKTHLLCAIGQELIARGRRMYFTTSALLVQDLLVAKRDLKLSRFIKKLAHFEGLIIDDLGYVQQSREEMEVLFTLLAERYERGSVFISSNLPFSKWEGVFKDPMTTAAAIDRLVHHCVILELNIPSYRVEQAKKAKDES